MSRKSNISDFNSNKRQKKVQGRIKPQKGKQAKIMEYVKQLIILTALQQAIAYNLEKEVEKSD
jgi:hypothetical protein